MAARSFPAVPLLNAVEGTPGAARDWRVVLAGKRLAKDARLRRRLGSEYQVSAHDRAREALAAMEGGDGSADVVIVEQVLVDGRGVDFLRELRVRHPDAIRLLVLDSADTQVVQHAINDAAVYQVVISPWQSEQLHLMVRRALESRELARIHRYLSRELKFADSVVHSQNDSMRTQLQEVYAFDRLVFASNAMAEVCNLARKAAQTDLPVLIEGETGTGKELLARAIHMFSQRHKLLFMAENCGAISDDLLQSELFGHRRGAFTGATTDRLGLFLAADGGTVFLDEISEISPAMQVGLLRFLQEGEVRALGSDQSRRTNVRIIAASNRPLRTLVAEGRFRQDLYYRLRGFELRMPPLRERREDIPALVTHMLDKYAGTLSRRVAGVTPEAMARLSAYSYPGNVRELENEVRRLIALAEDGDFITVRHLSPEVARASAPAQRAGDPLAALPGSSLKEKVEALEARLVCSTLDRCHWNHSKAARELGLSRVGLANKIRRYGIRRSGENDAGS
jgi:two-component system response regulator HupR/HoxA